MASSNGTGAETAPPAVRLILGSASPRRRQLLEQIGYRPFDIRPPDIDETPHPAERPRDYCRRIARQKSEALRLAEGEVALCADTTVALGRRILGKPNDETEARAFLRVLSGRRHKVITSLVLRTSDDRRWARDSVSTVRMKRLSDDDLSAYLATGDWRGKAGAYAIQGPAGAFIPWIAGSYTGIMGLPVAETQTVLAAAGLRPKHLG